jgi:hypothetical protein
LKVPFINLLIRVFYEISFSLLPELSDVKAAFSSFFSFTFMATNPGGNPFPTGRPGKDDNQDVWISGLPYKYIEGISISNKTRFHSGGIQIFLQGETG